MTHEDLDVLKNKKDVSYHDIQQKIQSLEDQIKNMTTFKADTDRRDIDLEESKIKINSWIMYNVLFCKGLCKYNVIDCVGRGGWEG